MALAAGGVFIKRRRRRLPLAWKAEDDVFTRRRLNVPYRRVDGAAALAPASSSAKKQKNRCESLAAAAKAAAKRAHLTFDLWPTFLQRLFLPVFVL